MALTEAQRIAAARRQAEYRQRRRLSNPDGINQMVRAQNIKHKFGLTLEQVEVLRVEQGNCCKICGIEFSDASRRNNPTTMVIDHCHATGRIRGLLCLKCNSGIGQFNDSASLLLAAVNYLGEC